jgi:hypothetical protein
MSGQIAGNRVRVLEYLAKPILLDLILMVDRKRQPIRGTRHPFFDSFKDPSSGKYVRDGRSGNLGEEAHSR